MKIKCPKTKELLVLKEDGFHNSMGMVYPKINDVYRLLSTEGQQKIIPFLNAFEEFRKPYIDKINSSLFSQLPYVSFEPGTWKLRQHDVSLIKSLALEKKSSVLEVGAWNGWLSNQMVGLGYEVTAVDYFTHHLDGLEAKKYYANTWTAIQMDIEELGILEKQFDLIVVNRACAHFTDLERSIKQLLLLLKPNGRILLTGVNFYRNPSNELKKLTKMKEEFETQFKTTFFFKKYKGVMDKVEMETLKNLGFSLKLYPELWLKSKLSLPFSKKPLYYFALYENRKLYV